MQLIEEKLKINFHLNERRQLVKPSILCGTYDRLKQTRKNKNIQRFMLLWLKQENQTRIKN